MRQLHFVGLTPDAAHLVVRTAPSPDAGPEEFVVVVDDTLRSVFAPADQEPVAEQPAAEAPEPAEPPVTPAEIVPRDIQVRVRAGESPDEVAASLGVPVERVMRFAGPVMDERLRIADEARRARARRTAPEGAEAKVVVFGEAVDDRFGAHGIDATTVTWDAHRRDDGAWVIVAEWFGGESTHAARWLFHRTSRSVTPSDDAATDLLSDRPIRPVTPTPPVRLVSAPRLAPGVVAFPPMPDALTGPLPVIDDVFDQDAPGEGPRVLAPYTVTPVVSVPDPDVSSSDTAGESAVNTEGDDAGLDLITGTADDGLLDYDEPPLPLGLADEPVQAEKPGGFGRRSGRAGLTNRVKRDEAEGSDADRAARARVPSWDDILLGVRRKSD